MDCQQNERVIVKIKKNVFAAMRLKEFRESKWYGTNILTGESLETYPSQIVKRMECGDLFKMQKQNQSPDAHFDFCR